MKNLIVLLITFGIASCVSMSKELQPVLAPAANIGNSVSCPDDCKNEWERAQIWIAKHAKWKIQTATNVLVETYNPSGYDPSYGFSATKEPTDSGYVITIRMLCGNLLGCDPKPDDIRKAFYYYVKNGVDLLAGHAIYGAIR